jgi:hypothetical protein
LRDRRDGYGAERLSQRSRICSVAWSGAAAEFHRRQKPVRRHIQARQPVFATASDQRASANLRRWKATNADSRVIGLRRRRSSLVVATDKLVAADEASSRPRATAFARLARRVSWIVTSSRTALRFRHPRLPKSRGPCAGRANTKRVRAVNGSGASNHERGRKMCPWRPWYRRGFSVLKHALGFGSERLCQSSVSPCIGLARLSASLCRGRTGHRDSPRRPDFRH